MAGGLRPYRQPVRDRGYRGIAFAVIQWRFSALVGRVQVHSFRAALRRGPGLNFWDRRTGLDWLANWVQTQRNRLIAFGRRAGFSEWRRPVLRNEKVQIIDELHDIFANAGLVVVAHQNGLTVGEATELRRKMKESNATYRVVKNRLSKRAIGETPYEGLSDLFQGQTAIAYSDDPVAAAKVAVAYAKSNDKLEILGGGMGEIMLDVNGVRALASLPSLDELRGSIVGMLSTPARRVAVVLAAPAGQLARLLQAHATQEEAA